MYVKLLFIIVLVMVGVGSAHGSSSTKSHTKGSKSNNRRKYRRAATCPCFTKSQVEQLEGVPDCQFEESDRANIEFLSGEEIIADVCSGPGCTNTEVPGCWFSIGNGDECWFSIASERPITKRENYACRAILREYCYGS